MFRSQGEDPPHHHNLFSSSYPPRPNILANETDHHLHHNRSRWKPNVEIAPSCPRCNSSNTKFCYYNNYSLTQPRYFCKGCRRYWTKGGSLRNVPIGGGCRKSRRAKTVRSSSLGTASTSYAVSGNIGSSSCSGISLDDDDQNPDVNGRNTTTTNSSSTNPSLRSSHDPSTIDLALVYAKFLNHDHKQTEKYPNIIPLDQHVMPEFCRELDSSVDLSNISEPSKLNAHVQFSHEQNNNNSGGGGCITGGGVLCCVSDLSSDTQFSEDNQQVMLLNEFDLNYERHQQQQQQNQQEQIVQERVSESTGFETCSYEVQPLLMPPQELMGQDMFWSNSPLIGSSSFAWQATQLQDLEPVPDDNTAISSNPLDENWSPFDLPSFEALSRP